MYLYAITDNVHVKIGFSNNVTKRLAQLQSGTSVALSLVFKVNCGSRDMAYRLEQIFHARYAAHRVKGEWFKISPNIVLQDLKFAKSVFPVMLQAFDQEKIRSSVLGTMSRTEIEAYIEQRWPTPKPVPVHQWVIEDIDECAGLSDDFPLHVAHLSWTFAVNGRTMTATDKITHQKLQELKLSFVDILGRSYRDHPRQYEPGLEETFEEFYVRWCTYTGDSD